MKWLENAVCFTPLMRSPNLVELIWMQFLLLSLCVQVYWFLSKPFFFLSFSLSSYFFSLSISLVFLDTLQTVSSVSTSRKNNGYSDCDFWVEWILSGLWFISEWSTTWLEILYHHHSSFRNQLGEGTDEKYQREKEFRERKKNLVREKSKEKDRERIWSEGREILLKDELFSLMTGMMTLLPRPPQFWWWWSTLLPSSFSIPLFSLYFFFYFSPSFILSLSLSFHKNNV